MVTVITGKDVAEEQGSLPNAWPKGSVTGLCARGGFEVETAESEVSTDHSSLRAL